MTVKDCRKTYHPTYFDLKLRLLDHFPFDASLADAGHASKGPLHNKLALLLALA